MKKRINYIFVLLSITIPVILISQIYWIRSAYTINRVQLEKDINQCLENSIQKENSIRPKAVTNIDRSDENRITIKSMHLNDSVNLDSILKNQKQQYKLKDKSISLHFDAGKISDSLDNGIIPDSYGIDLQSIMQTLISEELNNEKPININRLDSVFNQELNKRNINISYELQLKKDSSKFNAPANVISSRIMPVTLLQNHFIRASFIHSSQVVLSRMIHVLVASIMLIIIASLSFIYMFRTILKQKKMSEVKNDFINNMTHELKTPISTVSAAIEAMNNFGVLDDRQKTRKYLKLSQSELKNLSALIEKVLNISRLERDKIELKKEAVPIHALLEKIIQRHCTRHEKDIQCFVDEPCNDMTVYADLLHLENILNNLTDNAVKYGGKIIRIRYSCYQNEGYQYISVSDNGPGISKEHQKSIFDKFYRIPKGDVHDVKGFGLGLHYVKNIMLQHDGCVTVESVTGNGTTFTLKFPRYGN
ncbi:MAG: HAMP domain-containing histidine kinase [Bacteroidales bacterium]|nr:HAMP domain-containing histidine kinase [Bacteroidales bacterium]